jgi:hypothetical protein
MVSYLKRREKIKTINLTLDEWFPKYKKLVSAAIENNLPKFFFGKFDGKEVFFSIYGEDLVLTLKELSKLLNLSYERVQRLFYTKCHTFWKGTDIPFLIETTDYFKTDLKKFLIRSPILLKKKGNSDKVPGKKRILITYLGVSKFIAHVKDELALKFYYFCSERSYSLMKDRKELPQINLPEISDPFSEFMQSEVFETDNKTNDKEEIEISVRVATPLSEGIFEEEDENSKGKKDTEYSESHFNSRDIDWNSGKKKSFQY